MNKTVSCYCCFITILLSMCNFEHVYAKEQIAAHLNYKGKYTSDIKNYEIVVPQRVSKDGNFISHLVSHHHSKRSAKELDFIFYKIPIGGNEYLIELTPNRKLISPSAVVEIHKEDAGKLNKRDSGKNIEKGNMFENLDIRKLENTECHFSGHVKGENISKAALSTCNGLAGFIQINNGFYLIEPVAEHDPFVEDEYPHLLYKTDSMGNSSLCHTIGKITSSLADQVIRKRRESSGSYSTPMYIETLIVMDKTLISHHHDADCENYVLTVFNMAFNLFHDASLGLMMTLTIVRIIRLEIVDDEMNLNVNADAEKTLQYFQNWQYEINPGDDSHPNHHDVAVLITRVNVCYSPNSCGLLGLTTIGKACDPKLSAALCEDNGLRLGYVIAHEIGHLLGADHDSVNSTCNTTSHGDPHTVMRPRVTLSTQTWSKCSQSYFKAFFESGMGNCFLDEPDEHIFNVQDLLPGVMYNADFQCKHLITMDARECESGSTCTNLNCYIPGLACLQTHTQPADGTSCGENMWCHGGKCLVIGERPGVIDGNWGEWSAWSECSRTCGSGVASSIRNCDKPAPSHGGKSCAGERKRYKICSTMITTVPQNISDLIRFISEEVNVSFVGKPCETGRPSFRDIQCGEFDDWIYPEDGKTHNWRAHYYHDDNPCILYCISEENQITALRPRVIDGTMCYRGIRDICVGGTCKTLPCDLHFESNAVEDACGICHGDGTGCEFSEGSESLTQLEKGLTKLVSIPAGTRNIKVEETSPTLSRIIVRDKDTKDVYIRGKNLGMFSVPGSQAWLGMIRVNQESLHIPGPVSKPLSIWIQRLENVTVKWSMALPVEQQRKPEFAWDFLKWGPCSTKCGPGVQKSEPSCIEEKAGLVEDSFCTDLEMPTAKVRPCEITPCYPRWMVGDWRGCDQSGATNKQRKRVVYCIKTVGEGEGESLILPDSDCPLPKPHSVEPCENRQKREDTEFKNDISFFDEDPMYRSDTVEFGFHKKYDDYLKHFSAVSVPQRNSETVPLHLVSSPHFKYYFRVLQTPEDYQLESGNTEHNIRLPNSTMYDSQNQDSVSPDFTKYSPDFYKDTFSGNKIDVSQIKSKTSIKKRKSLPFKEYSPSGSGKRPEYIPEMNKKVPKYLNVPKNSYRYTFLNPNKIRESSKLTKKMFNTAQKASGKRLLHKKEAMNIYFVKPLYERKENSAQINQVKLNNRPICFQRTREINRRFSESNDMPYNLSIPGISNVIESLGEASEFFKEYYFNETSKNKGKPLNPYEQPSWNTYRGKYLSPKLRSFIEPFSKMRTREKLMAKIQSNDEKEEFDGSGLKIFKTENQKNAQSYVEPFDGTKINNRRIHRWLFQDRRDSFANPFDPLHSERSNYKKIHRAPNTLVGRNINLNVKALRNKRAHSIELKNPCSLRKMPDLSHDFERMDERARKKKKKRSSHKWKKPKLKEANSKSNKEITGNAYGSETRNYLNNLFHDSRSKLFSKQIQQSQPERPVINTGRLVIDKDLAADQEVDVLFQDEEPGEGTRYKLKKRPGQGKKRVTLKGQEVFDLYHQLQQRNDEQPLYRPMNSLSGKMNKLQRQEDQVEIDVKSSERKSDEECRCNITTCNTSTTLSTACASSTMTCNSSETVTGTGTTTACTTTSGTCSTTTSTQCNTATTITTTEKRTESTTTQSDGTTSCTTETTTFKRVNKTHPKIKCSKQSSLRNNNSKGETKLIRNDTLRILANVRSEESNTSDVDNGNCTGNATTEEPMYDYDDDEIECESTTDNTKKKKGKNSKGTKSKKIKCKGKISENNEEVDLFTETISSRKRREYEKGEENNNAWFYPQWFSGFPDPFKSEKKRNFWSFFGY